MTNRQPGRRAGLTIRNSTAEFLIFTQQAGDELNERSAIRKFRITADDGKQYQTQHYKLDANISVGYRVNSVRATQFRQWATQVLREFAKVQNKLHFAIHGKTAAELIVERARSDEPSIGLPCWEAAPHGKILKTDVGIAKNYLTQDELQAQGRIVTAYLDLAEDRAQRQIPMTMEDWAKQLDRFLELTDRGILQNAGRISAEAARLHAESESETYRVTQDRLFESDFDRMVKAVEKLEQTEPNVEGKGRGKKK